MGKSKELSVQEKWALIATCKGYIDLEKKKFEYGGMLIVHKQTGIPERTIRRVFNEYKSKGGFEGAVDIDMTPMKKGNVGKKKMLTPAVRAMIKRKNKLKKGRASLRALSELTEIPKSTLHTYVNEMNCEYESSWLKPRLTDQQKLKRLQFVVNLRDGNRHSFKEQENTIVVDESWFYLHDNRVKMRTFPGVKKPLSDKVQHKSHIPKIMFLTALARPDDRHRFNGKICIQRICKEKVALRRSVHHERGDVYMEDCNINHEVYESLMKVVIDNVKVKMPWLLGQPVIIQQDGASPHTARGVMDRLSQYGSTGGWNFIMVTQPPQSPDLNINDLSFFRSLKMRVNALKVGAHSLDQLYQAVLEAWANYDTSTLKVLWGHQYACYRCIMENLGGNDYASPHSGVRECVGNIDLEINMEAYDAARDHLRREGYIRG